MFSGLCSSHVGSGTIKDDDTAEAWRDLHPSTYKNLTLNTGQHPIECSRIQNLWEKPTAQLPSRLSIAWQSVTSLQGASHTQMLSRCQSASEPSPAPATPPVLGTKTKASWWLAFQAPSCLVTVVGAEGALSGYGKGQTCEPNPWLCKVGSEKACV